MPYADQRVLTLSQREIEVWKEWLREQGVLGVADNPSAHEIIRRLFTRAKELWDQRTSRIMDVRGKLLVVPEGHQHQWLLARKGFTIPTWICETCGVTMGTSKLHPQGLDLKTNMAANPDIRGEEGF